MSENEKKTYRVQYRSTLWAVLDVEASNEDEARDLADENFPHPNICGQCSGWGQDYYIEHGDWQPDDSAEGVWEA